MPQRYRIKKKEDVFQLLKKKRNFEFMSDRLLQELVNNMSVFRFKKGENILIQGKRTKVFFILITGELSVSVDQRFLYKLTRTGDVVGELSFITQNPCSATIKASADTGLVAITRELLKKVNRVEFFLWLCRILGDKLVRTSKIKTGTLDSHAQPPKEEEEEETTESENLTKDKTSETPPSDSNGEEEKEVDNEPNEKDELDGEKNEEEKKEEEEKSEPNEGAGEDGAQKEEDSEALNVSNKINSDEVENFETSDGEDFETSDEEEGTEQIAPAAKIEEEGTEEPPSEDTEQAHPTAEEEKTVNLLDEEEVTKPEEQEMVDEMLGKSS